MQRMTNAEKDALSQLAKKLPIVYQFCEGDLNKFVLLLRKGIYPYEDMDSWEKFNETLLPDKKDFYSNLNLEYITDKNYAHAKKLWEVFEIKNRSEYHDFCVQCDTLLYADVFGNFRNKYIEIYKLDAAHFLSALGLAWEAFLKKNTGKIRVINRS